MLLPCLLHPHVLSTPQPHPIPRQAHKHDSLTTLLAPQGFRTPEEVERFGSLMAEMCYIVATKYSGSLKGEHGTGRNVAPYVELEWGAKAYELMWQLKELFDPDGVINPGTNNARPW